MFTLPMLTDTFEDSEFYNNYYMSIDNIENILWNLQDTRYLDV